MVTVILPGHATAPDRRAAGGASQSNANHRVQPERAPGGPRHCLRAPAARRLQAEVRSHLLEGGPDGSAILPPPDELLATLPPAALAHIRALETVAPAQAARLAARVAELEARLGQNSANSARPPSSDGPHVEPTSPKTPSGKAKGG